MADTHTSYSWSGIRLNGIPHMTFLETTNRAQSLANANYELGTVFEAPEDMNITGGAVVYKS